MRVLHWILTLRVRILGANPDGSYWNHRTLRENRATCRCRCSGRGSGDRPGGEAGSCAPDYRSSRLKVKSNNYWPNLLGDKGMNKGFNNEFAVHPPREENITFFQRNVKMTHITPTLITDKSITHPFLKFCFARHYGWINCWKILFTFLVWSNYSVAEIGFLKFNNKDINCWIGSFSINFFQQFCTKEKGLHFCKLCQ